MCDTNQLHYANDTKRAARNNISFIRLSVSIIQKPRQELEQHRTTKATQKSLLAKVSPEGITTLILQFKPLSPLNSKQSKCTH